MEESIGDLVARITGNENIAMYITTTDLERLLKAQRVIYSPDTMSYILPYHCVGDTCKFKIIIQSKICDPTTKCIVSNAASAATIA
jgi:hypothetical protein